MPFPTPTTTCTPESFDIYSFPPTDLLKLLANCLTHIATTNDRLAPSDTTALLASSQDSRESVNSSPIWDTLTTGSQIAVSDPVSDLIFHSKDIPKISVEAYLLRIHKYCPTTNQVILSLLVYFDRMSKLFQDAAGRPFVINSFNVHRLLIAGYTVASKLSDDVYYKNSRYSKIGGLPLSELNRLETQFLLLNDFQLFVTSTDLQRSAEKLRESIELRPSRPISQTPSLQSNPQPLQSAIRWTINCASPMVRSSGRKYGSDALSSPPLTKPTFKNPTTMDSPHEGTDAPAAKIASPSFQRSHFMVERFSFKQFFKRRLHIRSFSNSNANPIDFEIRRGMKLRREAHHVHSTSESSSALDTDGFRSSFASDGD